MEQKIRVDVQLTKNDVIYGFLIYLGKGFDRLLLFFISLILYFCGSVILINLGFGASVAILGIFLTAFSLYFFMVNPILYAYNFLKNSPPDNKYSWIFSENNVCLETENSHEKLGWDRITDLIEIRTLFIIEKSNEKGLSECIFIPKRFFKSIESIKNFRKILRSQIATRKSFFFRHRRMLLWVGLVVFILCVCIIQYAITGVIN